MPIESQYIPEGFAEISLMYLNNFHFHFFAMVIPYATCAFFPTMAFAFRHKLQLQLISVSVRMICTLFHICIICRFFLIWDFEHQPSVWLLLQTKPTRGAPMGKLISCSNLTS